MRRLRRALNRLQCRYRDHVERCTMVLDLKVLTWRHTHSCDRCGFEAFSETRPATPVVLNADMGLPIPQQRQYLN